MDWKGERRISNAFANSSKAVRLVPRSSSLKKTPDAQKGDGYKIKTTRSKKDTILTQLIATQDGEAMKIGARTPTKYVYMFTEGNASMRALLGGKGAGLAEMTNLGLPVPTGFTITTEACNAYSKEGHFPAGMTAEYKAMLAKMEDQTGKRFGDPSNPLLVSVRSGAMFSMPGMMDTVLNLGMNPKVRDGLAKLTNDPRFAADSYRRFIQLYGEIVLDVSEERFDHILNKAKGDGRQDTDLSLEELNEIAEKYLAVVLEVTGEAFPEDPHEQLEKAIVAVFRSWNGRRAVDYRRLNKISDDLGTAVNVQMMVFGNMGDDCATGVAFTRNPSTGEPGLYGEYLINAQGEDVVAGIRTPRPISEMEREMPVAYAQFNGIGERLEKHYLDMQDMEFTIERGRLYMLQTRNAKRTGKAAVKTAVDFVKEGMITKEKAVLRVEPEQLEQLLHPMIVPEARLEAQLLTKGLPGSPGAASGTVVFDPDDAVELKKLDKPVILVREETAPKDFHGMVAAEAVLTARGGQTSHAAVVMRGMGRPCVVGAGEVRIDDATLSFSVNGTIVKEGDTITLDGATGEVFLGQLKTQAPELDDDFRTFMSWANEFRKIKVRANADNPTDALVARGFGAEGIGLDRTEHMFFGDRLEEFQEMIIAETLDERRKALAKIEPYQTEDFAGIFRAMAGFPVTIRLLDPPLHEFLPHTETDIRELAEKLGITYAKLEGLVKELGESNPMLGTRGCRLGILFPEITEMQSRAIFKAAMQVRGEGIEVLPEVMIPLVGAPAEFRNQRAVTVGEAEKLGFTGYLVGTMIEVPRAALVADEIAEDADFFSFGTNDLTQTTFGISRDDSSRFVPHYIETKIYLDDPFKTLDQKGVGKLVQVGTRLGRETKPNLKVGVCGEHGGDPASVIFFANNGLDYVSCSPLRVPVAQLAAAHAALLAEQSEEPTAA